MSARATQRTRVLALLVRVGERGLTQADVSPHGGVIDGGKPIARLASRIEELRNDHGVPIVGGERRQGFEVYRLAVDAALPPVPPTLFDGDAA